MQSLRKKFIGEVGLFGAQKLPQNQVFEALPAWVWAEPKSFLVVPEGGLGVCKSTPEFWSWGSLGALRTHV